MPTPSHPRTVLVTGAAKRLGRSIALAPAAGGVRGLLPRVVAHFGRVDAVVNSASLFEHDNAATFGFAALEKHLRSNTAAPVLLAQALHQHVADRAAQGEADAQGAVVNLLDQKLWNQNPDFVSYTLSKAALEAAGPCWPSPWRRACAWWAWRRASR